MQVDLFTPEQRKAIADNALFYAENETKYDYGFDEGDETLYCSELFYHCVNKVVEGTIKFKKHLFLRAITPHELREYGYPLKVKLEIGDNH